MVSDCEGRPAVQPGPRARPLDVELVRKDFPCFERGIGHPCQAYLDTYTETIRLGRLACRDAEASLPADVPEQLVEAVLAARSRS